MPANRCASYIVFLSLLQVLCSSFFLRAPSFLYANSLMFLVSGLAISFLLLKLPPLSISLPRFSVRNRGYQIKLGIYLISFMVMYFFCQKILDATPLSIENADMLPIIKVMGQRFLQGEWNAVYSPINEIWNGVQPIYPPALWMSFLPAQLFSFDLRWITVSGLYLSLAISIFLLPFTKSSRILIITSFLSMIVLLIWLLTDKTNNVIRLSEEGIVYFFYVLMVVAIVCNNAWLIGFMAGICLLSRFAIIGWLPGLTLYWLLTKQFTNLLKAIAVGLAIVLLLVIVPFGWKPVQIFAQLPAGYVAHAQKVWDAYPQHFYQSLGLAKFFGRSHVGLLHQLLVSGSFIVPILFFIYFLQQQKRRPSNNFLLASFQLVLTVFYNLIDVSYLYLFYTPVVVSLAIACVCINAQSAKEVVREN